MLSWAGLVCPFRASIGLSVSANNELQACCPPVLSHGRHDFASRQLELVQVVTRELGVIRHDDEVVREHGGVIPVEATFDHNRFVEYAKLRMDRAIGGSFFVAAVSEDDRYFGAHETVDGG